MRARIVLFAVAVALVLSPATPVSAAPAVARRPDDLPLPRSMAALGDSITQGFNACGRFEDCPSRSWSTGDDEAVGSQYQRLLAREPAIRGHATNLARSGAKVASLVDQVDTALPLRPDYVTILIGANDACTSSESSMTPVDQFRSSLGTALWHLRRALPHTRVLVVSIPDIEHLWEIEHRDRSAQVVWYVGGVCQSMLGDARDVSDGAMARRARVEQRVTAFNEALRAGCAAYGSFCRFDGNAVFDHEFTSGNVSLWDHFHPDVTGQAVLANVANDAGWQW